MNSALATHKLPAWLVCGGPDGDVVISTQMRLCRNLSHHRFISRASLFERASIFEDVSSALKASPKYGSFSCVNFMQLEKKEQQFLVEERLASPSLVASDGERGIIHDEALRLCIMVNEEDHLRLQSLDAGLRPQELWVELDAIDDDLGTRLDFAFDSRRGFLTSRLANAGTGLAVSFLLHLPGLVLTHASDAVLHDAGGQSKTAGNMFEVSNAAFMGACESECIENCLSAIRHIVECERSARQKLLSDRRQELTDKISRAWGVLCHATTLDINEYLDLSSALRLGIECNLFDKCTIDDLNRLMMFVLPAHLQTYCQKALNNDQCKEARADLVKTNFARSAKEYAPHENG